MKTSQIIVVCLALVVGYIAASALNRPSSAQPPAPQPVGQELAVWRYQLTVPTQGEFENFAFLTDTATGRCWRRYSTANQWDDWGSPAERK
ncbi:MAG: hypothetical protein ACLQIB_39395 [Isosphaeraceae bacterium]